MFTSDISVLQRLKWLAAVAGDNRLSRAELAICCIVADMANKQGTAFPSAAYLARRVGVSKRGAKYAIASLLAKSVLLYEPGNRTRSNRYQINMAFGSESNCTRVVNHSSPQGSEADCTRVVKRIAPRGEAQFTRVVKRASPEQDHEQDHEQDQYNKGVFSSEFLEFWEAYPRKTGQDEAYREWQKTITKADPHAIITAARSYAESDKGQSEYVRSPKNWLCAGNWKDPPSEWELKRKPKSESQHADLLEASRLEDERWRQKEQARNESEVR